MSYSPVNVGINKLSGKSSEKSNFAQTCNLLSQYLKENRKLETKGMAEKQRSPAATMNLLPNMEKPIDLSREPVAFLPSNVSDGRKFSPEAAEIGTGTAQMTIFYGGKVMVFDEFPANKAMEIINLANSGGGFSGSEQNIASIAGVGSHSPHECLPHQSQAIVSDFPMTRRRSLYRFFAKRKDRIAARAPYQSKTSAGDLAGVKSKPWTDLEGPCELKLW